ncbi:uncharacterized protein LOC116245276 [Nymphaea colorata]|uniref:uncharacterized protein LOC116245276 n=1 Tax=Nymphaea colorata TaxID=210225 RepID=UPI00129EB591|nr:uncharacterized protein LOC116245276 [Nymphaea colorata]
MVLTAAPNATRCQDAASATLPLCVSPASQATTRQPPMLAPSVLTSCASHAPTPPIASTAYPDTISTAVEIAGNAALKSQGVSYAIPANVAMPIRLLPYCQYTCSICQVNGCEICNAVIPTQCVTCSSLYYLSSNACYSCGLSMTGCLNCLTSTHCLKCMVGSYLAANFTCQSCFYLFKGCAECSATSCTVCQGGYTMNVTSCATCIAFLPGCLYCTSTTVCLSCQSGYYAAASTVIPVVHYRLS